MLPCQDLTDEQKDWFHGESTYAKAQKICRGCPAKQQCLDVALRHEVPGVGRHGVWGSLSVSERNKRYGRVE